MRKKAQVMNERDNVAVALKSLKQKETVMIQKGDEYEEVTLLENIPRGHKFAIEDIEEGMEVIKYGEVIGWASQRIRKGERIHDLNLRGKR